jgi:hypothetical protein
MFDVHVTPGGTLDLRTGNFTLLILIPTVPHGHDRMAPAHKLNPYAGWSCAPNSSLG